MYTLHFQFGFKGCDIIKTCETPSPHAATKRQTLSSKPCGHSSSFDKCTPKGTAGKCSLLLFFNFIHIALKLPCQ